MSISIKRLEDNNPELCLKLRKYCYVLNGIFQEVHGELGPFLNEYIYQEALAISLEEHSVPFEKEYYFTVNYHGKRLQHKHYVDFLCYDNVLVECKAVEGIGSTQRQQLWNYMRLTRKPIGVLINFAPVHDQCEHYYLDTSSNTIYMF